MTNDIATTATVAVSNEPISIQPKETPITSSRNHQRPIQSKGKLPTQSSAPTSAVVNITDKELNNTNTKIISYTENNTDSQSQDYGSINGDDDMVTHSDDVDKASESDESMMLQMQEFDQSGTSQITNVSVEELVASGHIILDASGNMVQNE